MIECLPNRADQPGPITGRLCCLVAGLAWLLVGGPATAAARAAGADSNAAAATPDLAVTPSAVVDREQAGRDFALQGEYVGQATGGWRAVPLGMQVVAQADRKLLGVVLRGGLPGAGWTGDAREPLSGDWRPGVGRLAGQGWRATIATNRLWLYDARGVLRGVLHKVERSSPTMGLLPPPGAIVLFAGGPSDELTGARITPDGLLQEGALTKRTFRDFHMHVEFRTPFMPAQGDQQRGNSGVYLQQRYEVQILDSFGLEGIENECGALYKLKRPLVHMCYPPLSWQTYDIDFRAARFDEAGRKIQPALLTVRQNGVIVQNRLEIPSKTGNGQVEGPAARPILFQNHRDPVRFRNLWIVEQEELAPVASSS